MHRLRVQSGNSPVSIWCHFRVTLLHGLDELLRDELHIPVFVADNALRCVAEGTGILLENLHLVD